MDRENVCNYCDSSANGGCTECNDYDKFYGKHDVESLVADVERLKEFIKKTFVNNLHIFCPSCKEKDCLCMLDSTCEKLRNILDGKE
jgi:hypothetical protein